MRDLTTGPRRAAHTLAAIAAMAMLALTSAHATEIRHWKRDPIEIKLPVDTERIVVFGRDVRVGLPAEIADADTLRVQSTGGAVYFKARETFDTQRVQIQDLTSGRIMLLDLTGVDSASDETIRIEADTEADGAHDAQAHADESSTRPVPPEAFGDGAGSGRAGAPIPVRLVRHAAQALYSPQRVLRQTNSIHRVAVTRRTFEGLLPAYPVRARPVAAWRAAPYTVTAIEIVNRDTRRSFSLDPRNLAGDFYAASFMHDTIGQAGTNADTTTLFAVTKNGDLSDALSLPDRPPESAHED